MTGGRKYQPLFEYLRGKAQSEVTLSFSQIEILINKTLPISARNQRAWWSNRKKGALQASAWMEAGYEVKKLDLKEEQVTFRGKTSSTYNVVSKVDPKGSQSIWNSTKIGELRQHMGLTQTEFARRLGVRQATVSEWERGVYQVKTSTSKHLSLVAEQVGFKYSNSPSD